MKNFKKMLLCLCCLSIIAYSCKEEPTPSPKMSISIQSELTVKEEGTATLTATLTPSDANAAITWASDNPLVATVTAIGTGGTATVTGVKEGITIIYAKSGNITSDACVVTVTKKIIECTDCPPPQSIKQARSEKRGVSFSFQMRDDVELLSSSVSWSYNWGDGIAEWINVLFKEHEMDYFPMAWNSVNKDRIRAHVQANPNCKYILAFNEPNLKDQANMTPAEAAAKWHTVKEIAAELNLKIISPAMNYGTLAGYHDPIKWLDEFFNQPGVSVDDVAGISIHSYVNMASSAKGFIDSFKKYGKPIWMTEFCAWEGGPVTLASQMNYMSQMLNYMESDPDVARYAWFIPRSGKYPAGTPPYMALLTSVQPIALTELGKVFVNISTLDKNAWYVTEAKINAEHYSNTCVSESVGVGVAFVSGPSIRPTTDPQDDNANSLELYNFSKDQWVEYQINVPEEKTYKFKLRHASFRDSEISIDRNGSFAKSLLIPATGSDTNWETTESSIQLPAGKHTLRFTVSTGAICLNWFALLQ